MRKRDISKAIGLLSLSSIVIVSGCSTSVQGSVNEESPVSVEVSSVQKELLGTGAVYTGTVTPTKEVKITSKVAGEIVDLPVKVGTKVKKGQVLVKIDDTDLRHALEKAEAAVSVAEANVESAKVSHESSVSQAKSGTVQSKSGMSQSKGSMIQSKSGMIQSKSGIIQAKNAVIQAENSMSQADDNIKKAESAVKQAKNAINDRKIAAKKELQALNDAKTNLKRIQGLYEESLASKVQLEQAETAVVNAQATYDSGKVESDTLQDKLETSEKALTTAKEAYANAESTHENAEKAYENAKTAYENAETSYENASEGYENASEGYEQAKKQEEIAQNESGIQASEQTLKQAQVNAQIAQETLDDTVITSPISGVVSKKNAEEGELASTQTPVLILNDFNKVNILTYISTDNIDEVKVGNSVQVKIASLNIITKGKVKTISPLDENGKGYPVEIEVSNPKSKLKEGMIADIRIIPPDAKQGIVVSSKAIERKGEKTFVYVAKGDHAERKEVKVEKVEGSLLVVTSGLVNGEKIITSNLPLLSDKAKITYSLEKSK